MIKKITIWIIVVLCFSLLSIEKSFAGHIAGGEVYYSWARKGSNANNDVYKVTLRLFRDCAAQGDRLAEMPTQVTLAIFNNGNRQLIESRMVQGGNLKVLSLIDPSKCIINAQPVCYQVREFTYEVELSRNVAGYTIAFQTCCRSNDITNVVKQFIPGGASTMAEGATYVANIPGTATVPLEETNSSPVFSLRDTVLICSERSIYLTFGATDPDKDSLSYTFCGAFDRGNATAADDGYVSTAPPYNQVSYTSGFSGTSPLGSRVTINPTTGVISGVAPRSGVYVVNVCVNEWRNGKIISTHRKDFSVKVTACDIADADLPITMKSCDDYTVKFENNSNSPLINSYYWSFGDNNFSTDANPSHTYANAGTYNVQLIINRGEECTDTAKSVLNVFPGLKSDFNVDMSCFRLPIQFNATSTTRYGGISSYKWNFSNNSSQTVTTRNPTQKFDSPGDYTVTLITVNDKGCEDTMTKVVTVLEEPLLNLKFTDTLICTADSIRMFAEGDGDITWSPNYNIDNIKIPNPTVWPKQNTTYSVTLFKNGCTTTKQVLIRTTNQVDLFAGNDTTICLTDSITFRPVSNGLIYEWLPAADFSDHTQRNATAGPKLTVNDYRVRAWVGTCSAIDNITVRTVPYPKVFAGNDTTICFGDTASLNGTTDGSIYKWTPVGLLSSPTDLSTKAFPLSTQSFVLTVTDTKGCPKPVSDTVIVNVREKLNTFAGNDTNVVITQPVQLFATGLNAVTYKWEPVTYLSDANIQNPVFTINGLSSLDNNKFTYKVTAYTPEGCWESDEMVITVYVTKPSIFIPNAFTPNNDGKNETFKPVLAGIRQLLHFRIYNRYGEVVFETNKPDYGWNGMYKGNPQPSNAYVYHVSCIDYTGKVIEESGSFSLIR
ncbi:PKD domain-containing protein [Polluticaenibacter yanchengensis]|uniref:PKD domain-containing protein n=1 Tax=Polluticaenibacter yanchengensis TaxID=3014562 RepID=A0ABT4UNT0_9BACT|nr:PKD domain-containing protein [Chitinophagaceae bacterium LY-5]